MEIVRGETFLFNGVLLNADRLDDVLKPDSLKIYEVFRVINSKSILLDDHLDRLILSILGIGKQIPENFKLRLQNNIDKLIEKSSIQEGNIKIVVQYYSDKEEIVIYFIPHFYPMDEDYKNGVDVGLFKSIRENPNIKAESNKRVLINSIIKQKKLYEVLLVNEMDKITEGSRTNIFFIDFENKVYTAPDNCVLKGITRKYAIKICNDGQIPCLLNEVTVNELKNYQSAFLTGTSPKILPVKRIENITFDVNSPVLKTIMKAYDRFLNVR